MSGRSLLRLAQELRQVIERGRQENLLELALRGQPRSPFYMVGRIGRAIRGHSCREEPSEMLVDGEEPRSHQEVIFDLEGGSHEHRNQSQEGTPPLACPAASPGGAVDLE